MGRDEKIIITKYHGHCVASSCGRCLQRFSEKYDKNCKGTNKKCWFYAETGRTREEVIDIINKAISECSITEDIGEKVLNTLLEIAEPLK